MWNNVIYLFLCVATFKISKRLLILRDSLISGTHDKCDRNNRVDIFTRLFTLYVNDYNHMGN